MTTKTDSAPEEPPPLGSWPRIYAAVIACALATMGLVALFSRWNY